MAIDTIKSNLFNNWHLVRILRLLFGVFILIQAITTGDFFIGLIASIFLLQAITNTGCCGASGCVLPDSSTKENKVVSRVEYEEIKSRE